jgi:hypothetical protein
MPDASHGLAAAVRAALDSSRLTVRDLSAETRIRPAILEDLVEGRTESSHGDVYVRGHLRAIAHATGTDAGPLLRAYEEQTGATLVVPDLEPTVHLHHHTVGSLALPLADKPERRGPRWGLAVALAAAVLVGLVVVGNLRGPDGGGPPGAGAAGQVTPAPVTKKPAPSAVPRPSGAALRVQVAGSASWVQVTRDGDKLFEGILEPGAVRDFRDAAALSVRVGNAGAVRLTCGGRGVAAGEAGQVRAFRCVPSGLSPV